MVPQYLRFGVLCSCCSIFESFVAKAVVTDIRYILHADVLFCLSKPQLFNHF